MVRKREKKRHSYCVLWWCRGAVVLWCCVMCPVCCVLCAVCCMRQCTMANAHISFFLLSLQLFQACEKALADGIAPPPSPPIQVSIDEAVHVAVSAASSCDTETRSAVESAFKAMTAKLGGQSSRVSSTVSKRASVGRPSRRISLIIVAFTCTHDADEVIETLHQLCPDVPVAGMTTCRGVVVNGTWSTHR